ncbi:unnamed protein product [Cunninghamella echinulata]
MLYMLSIVLTTAFLGVYFQAGGYFIINSPIIDYYRLLYKVLRKIIHSLTIPTQGPILNERGFYSNRNESIVKNNSMIHPTPTKTTSNSSPVVETIYIIESDGHTYHELGGGNYRTPTASSTVNYPNASNIEKEVSQDTAVLHRLITITTVVGGVGIGLLVTGTLIYMRLRAKRKRMKAEMNLYHNNSSFASYLSNIAGINKRKRARRQHQCNHHSDNDDNNNDDNNNDDNNNDHNHQNSSSNSHHHHQQLTTNTTGPSESSSNLPMNPTFQESIEMNIIPSAPPDPVLLDEQVRSRRQISMISQQQAFTEPISASPPSAIPLPSAPSAKELMMAQPSSSPSPSSLSITAATTTPLPPLHSSSSRLYHRRNISSSSSSTSPSTSHHTNLSESTSSTHHHNQRQQQQQHDFLKPTTIHENELQGHSPVTPDIPPPAYTPSAPPLFVLPPSHRRRSADEISLDRYRH